MTGGRCASLHELPADALALMEEARRGVLSTIDARGRPHSVPVCYAIRAPDIVIPIDAKPKTGKRLGRLVNLERDPRATLLVDRWSEDWSRLGWVMVRGTAQVEGLGSADDLIARYPQYEEVALSAEAIVLRADDVAWWLWG